MNWELCCDLMLIGIFGSTTDFDIFYTLIEEKLDITFQNFLLNNPNRKEFEKHINENKLTIEGYKNGLNEKIKEYNIQFIDSKEKIGESFANEFFIKKEKIKNEKISIDWLKERINYSGKILGIDSFLPSDLKIGIRNYSGGYFSYLTIILEDIFYFFVKGESLYHLYKKNKQKYAYVLGSDNKETQEQKKEDSLAIANIVSNFRNSYILIQVFIERFLTDIDYFYFPVPKRKREKIDSKLERINEYLEQLNKLSATEKNRIEVFIKDREFRNNLMHNSPDKESLDLSIHEWKDKTKNYLEKSLEICSIYMKALDIKYAARLFKEFDFNKWESIAQERNRIENKYVESKYQVINE